jgi:hypothetical protein
VSDDSGLLSGLGGLATGVGAVATAAFGIFQYFRSQTYRDKVAASRKAFDDVVEALGSTNEIDRLAGAILLRRFFDPNSEVNPPFRKPLKAKLALVLGWTSASRPSLATDSPRRDATGPAVPAPQAAASGTETAAATKSPKWEASDEIPKDEPIDDDTKKRTPYRRDAVDVIAAILKVQPSGNFQKLLADGLGYAPNLWRADLQRTNLRNVYLGSRGEKRILNMCGADFYRADLAGASLKGAIARGAVFYQARLADAVLKNADLRGANFLEADLLGANFAGANLKRATFLRTRNIPAELKPYIKGKDWVGPDELPEQSEPRSVATYPLVYVSKPPAASTLIKRRLSRSFAAGRKRKG